MSNIDDNFESALEVEKATTLAEIVLAGQATEQQQGMLARLIQTALASDLATGQRKLLTSTIDSVTELQAKIKARFETQLEVELDSLDCETALKYMKDLTTMAVQVLDLQRKIVQSPKNLFSDQVISDEERAFAAILQSFSTKAEKTDFINQVVAIVDGMKSKSDFE